MPLWRVIIHKELRTCRVMANIFDDCIETHVVCGLEPPQEFANIKSNRILVGVIELNREETLLVAQTLHSSLGTNDVA
jgi:hypothetical protein